MHNEYSIIAFRRQIIETCAKFSIPYLQFEVAPSKLNNEMIIMTQATLQLTSIVLRILVFVQGLDIDNIYRALSFNLE